MTVTTMGAVALEESEVGWLSRSSTRRSEGAAGDAGHNTNNNNGNGNVVFKGSIESCSRPFEELCTFGEKHPNNLKQKDTKGEAFTFCKDHAREKRVERMQQKVNEVHALHKGTANHLLQEENQEENRRKEDEMAAADKTKAREEAGTRTAVGGGAGDIVSPPVDPKGDALKRRRPHASDTRKRQKKDRSRVLDAGPDGSPVQSEDEEEDANTGESDDSTDSLYSDSDTGSEVTTEDTISRPCSVTLQDFFAMDAGHWSMKLLSDGSRVCTLCNLLVNQHYSNRQSIIKYGSYIGKKKKKKKEKKVTIEEIKDLLNECPLGEIIQFVEEEKVKSTTGQARWFKMFLPKKFGTRLARFSREEKLTLAERIRGKYKRYAEKQNRLRK
jgi:hypothetical protein